jgi:ribosomal protein L30E
MKFNRTITASLLLSVLSVGAIAQPQITREQVKAELQEAIRTGDIIEGEGSLTRYERNPSAYPARPVVVGKTRDQVKAELREAIRTGDIVDGYEGLTRYERNPSAYPARTLVAGKTRDEVKAELAEAIRTGDIVFGESSLKLNEQQPGRYLKAPAVARTDEPAAHAANKAPETSQLR